MSRSATGAAPGGARGSARLIVFLGFAALLAGGLVGYTLKHRRPPIPADADHHDVAEPQRCLSCHGPGGRDPRGPNHPLSDQCFNCHERA